MRRFQCLILQGKRKIKTFKILMRKNTVFLAIVEFQLRSYS